MGIMIKGRFQARDPGPETAKAGTFQRQASTIRHWITPDGTFAPDKDRYHLYVAWNCPWAHRTLLARTLLDLTDHISVSYAKPNQSADGWIHDETGAFADSVLNITALHQIYARQVPAYTGRLTVPVLWDRKTQQIVSNESADIVRMLGSFGRGLDLWPAGMTPLIKEWNTRIHRDVNTGVYRAGFALTQKAYDAAVTGLFDAFDTIEAHLETTDWLVGDQFTEADLRLFPTLARFDVAYHYAFKCNIRKLVDYPNLWTYARRIHAMPGVAETVDFEIYKQGYFSKSDLRNPLGIIPKGPMVDWTL